MKCSKPGIILFCWGAILCQNARAETGSLGPMAKIYEARAIFARKHSSGTQRFLVVNPFEAPATNDMAENLADEVRYRTLEDMQAQGLMKASIPVVPWSDSYWPIYSGEIADRYADPSYIPTLDWKSNERFLKQRVGKGPVKDLSPAEKYDLLIGDKKYSLTHEMIEAGAPYNEQLGGVESWMGLCNGWAAASFMMPRPGHSVKVRAKNGTMIELYPADMRALATLLWANGAFAAKLVGSRCDAKDPPLDPNGRPLDLECRDTNPATWHIMVVNQIGVSQRSFVIDAVWATQVWNQPVISYSYQYKDSQTGELTTDLKRAIVSIDSHDPKKSLRAATAVSYVDIKMTVTYGTERTPDIAITDNSSSDKTTTTSYNYQLELDADKKIIGGEWDENVHPDFMWVPKKGERAISVGDQALATANDNNVWEEGKEIPASWEAAALQASAQSQPLAKIVETLIRWSNE